MIGGVLQPRTPYNSVECLTQLVIRIKPIMDKITRKIEKGCQDQLIQIIQDIRTQIEDNVSDISSDAINRETCPRIGRSYSLFDALELLCYKISMALNDNVVPNFMPYFYIHFTDQVVPYLKVKINENEFLDDILKKDLKAGNKTFRNFGEITTPPQLFFIRIEREDQNDTPLKLRETLDLTEFGSTKYQLCMFCNAKQPGRDNSIIMFMKDSKGWFSVDPTEINALPQFTLSKETRHSSTPTILVAYIQGKSNIETFRPGTQQSVQAESAISFIKKRELERAENVRLDSPRTLNITIFDPAKMAMQKMPEVQFRSTEEYKGAIRSLRNNLIAKGANTAEIYFRQDDTQLFDFPPIEIPEDNGELLGDCTGSNLFVNDFIQTKPIKVNLVNLTKPDFYKFSVNFAPYHKISAVRDYVNRALAGALNLPQKNRYIYYWDGDSYQIADDDQKIDSFSPPDESDCIEFYFTTDGRVPDGAHVLRIRFVEVEPFYQATDAQFSFNTVQTMDALVQFAQKKFQFPDIDFYTFQEQGPRLYVFPSTLGKTREGKKLSPMMLFDGLKSPLFAQNSLKILADTCVLSFVIAEQMNPLKLTNDAFRLAFDVGTTYKEIKPKLFKTLDTDKVDVMYVVNQGDRVPLADKMPAKDLTKGVFFVKILE